MADKLAPAFRSASLFDILERAGSTAAQAAIATVIATASVESVDLSWLVVVICTAAATFLSVLKGAIAVRIGDRSASLLRQWGVSRDPTTGRFIARSSRVTYEAEEVTRDE